MQRQDDSYLVARAQAGYLDAFEMLVRRHQDRAYGVALRLLGNSADAEDATQDALIQAWKALPRFRADSAFSTWLHRIVTNRCLDLQRTPKAVPLTDANAVPGASSAEIVEAQAQGAAVADAIARLPAEIRVPLVLARFGGFSYEEIAEILGITVPGVKGRVHRARRELLRTMRAWRD